MKKNKRRLWNGMVSTMRDVKIYGELSLRFGNDYEVKLVLNRDNNKDYNGEDVLEDYPLVVCEWIFKDDEITDAPMKFLASEITREKLFLKLKEDLPYSVDVETEKWEDFNNGDIKIQQVIKVFKESQKAIILGKNGSMLKEINIQARKELEAFFNKKVHLFLFVQVNDKWINEKFSN